MNFLRRFPWYLLGGVILGLVLGLIYAWLISPVRYVNGTPDALGPDYKDQYRLLIASSYQVDSDLTRASARLAALGDADPFSSLTGQAARLLDAGDPEGKAYSLLLLAQSFQPATPAATTASTASTGLAPEASATATLQPVPTGTPLPPTETPSITDTPGGPPSATPEVTDTPAPTRDLTSSPTPLPTRTPVPTVGAPYALTNRESICNANQMGVLLEIVVRNAAGAPVPGVDITVSWAGGREHIFTGLKPELGDGYADFTMTPGTLYTVQVASGGSPTRDLEAPSCENAGATWYGSLLLTYQQP